ncbi:helix-turn-helix domain-containing protein [Granulosicoccus antarcticus]|uniref:HTH iclR-type domain-containing protein n=1 Tax=Granulosicoccus antarcticus IMCC3135 TaxID=1192854 RepID=A0A2Z2NS46_9GAMM|nr:helix-turn-helix domain-containing protein [Granulosicoccus antarcticus]ASJ71560.1 hypothetical protein IMCC3135_07270 [Granulosicoccus antarcticus IMCC3135]
MSKNFVRILRLAESLSDAPSEGLTKAQIVERAGLPSSTVYRLLSEMEQTGYVYTTPEGRLLPNFSFERRIGIGNISPIQLRQACASISAELESASEIILRRGHSLLWHVTDEHPLQAIKLRAHPGYVRSTYELDSISRLALAYCNIDDIESSWDLSSFHEVGVQGNHLDWHEARKRILATDRQSMQFDMLGNAKGIRRFSIAITTPEGELVSLLTVAEAAIPVRDEEAHIARIRSTLESTKVELELCSASSHANGGLKSVTLPHKTG